jgi:ribosomal protein S18 acetylase RimI-like enzyme
MSDLAWRIEETCLHAWPALREERMGPWLLRFADGLSRRSNSANPTSARIADIAGDVAACADRYRASGLPAIFRIPSLVDPAVDAHLDELGYGTEGTTLTLHGTDPVARRDPVVEIASSAGTEWLETMSAWQKRSPRDAAVYAQLVGAIGIPAGFASLRVDGATAALAYGAIHDGRLCFESVITAAAQRGRGYARRTLQSLIAWAAAQGARAICLQVEAANAPAIALYRSLGATTELYRYHYRRAPARD